MSKAMKTAVITLLLVVSLVISFGAGCVLGPRTPQGPVEELDIVAEAWNIIFQDYVDTDRLDASVLSQGAIEGMVEALDDPYTSYLDTEAYQLALSGLGGKFEGIGAEVSIKDEQLMIIAPLPDSPADKAGIRAGDVILEIDGRSTSEMSLVEAVLNIRGPKGTAVRLLILHQDATEPEEIEIIRAEIELTSVDSEIRGDIAYISITHFSQRTDEELFLLLKAITWEEPTGIILDLRSNPGCILDVVIDVASYFL
jgi:carboxyl-terminal processing protease